MDSFEPTKGRSSPRRELQGPRPTPLRVRKDSHKIKKPPVAPAQPQPGALPVQQRPPVIIYTVSPKVIHTHPSEFMSLVQRLTGASSSSSSASASASASASTSASASASASAFHKGEALSPAARLAVIERPQGRVVAPKGGDVPSQADGAVDVLDQLGLQGGARLLDRTGSFPGILSPVPSTLPAISPNFFSPLPEVNSFNFLHELSPAFHTHNRSIISTENNNMTMVSPSLFLTTPFAPSPNAYWDLFQQYQDI